MAADVTEGRFRLASPATANVLAILGAAPFLAVLPLAAVTRNLTGSSVGASLPMILPFGGVGLVVARRHRHAQSGGGWILLGFAVLLVASNRAGARGAHLPFRAWRAAARPDRGAAGPAVGTGDRARRAGSAAVPRWHSSLCQVAVGAAGLPGGRRLLAGVHLRRCHRHDRRAPHPGGYRRQPDHHRPACRECRLADIGAAAAPARPGGVLAVVRRPPGGHLPPFLRRAPPAAEMAPIRRRGGLVRRGCRRTGQLTGHPPVADRAGRDHPRCCRDHRVPPRHRGRHPQVPAV